jgi:hypothetical protein
MKKAIFVILACVAIISGCDSGNSSTASTGVVAIKCATLNNNGDPNACSSPVGVNTVKGAITIIDAGIITRAEMIEATLAVSNTTGTDWLGYWGMVFDAGCSGAPTWEIAPVQPTPAIGAGNEWSVTVGGSCGDMPLGQRTMTATLYGPDPAEVLDVVQVQFELVE